MRPEGRNREPGGTVADHVEVIGISQELLRSRRGYHPTVPARRSGMISRLRSAPEETALAGTFSL